MKKIRLKGCLGEKKMQIEMLFGREQKGIRLKGGWGKKNSEDRKRQQIGRTIGRTTRITIKQR